MQHLESRDEWDLVGQTHFRGNSAIADAAAKLQSVVRFSEKSE